MIPYAIAGGKIRWKTGKQTEIRILDLSPCSFTFRLSVRQEGLQELDTFEMVFYLREGANRQKSGEDVHSSPERIRILVDKFQVSVDEETPFYTVFRVETEDESFRACALQVMREYMEYVELKLNHDSAELSEVLTGYDSRGEQIISGSLKEWKQKLTENLKHRMGTTGLDDELYKSVRREKEYVEDFLEEEQRNKAARGECSEEKQDRIGKWEKIIQQNSAEITVELDSPELQDRFLSMEWSDFQEYFWRRQGLEWHPLAKCPITCVYIGSQYCFRRIPSEGRLKELIDRAVQFSVKPVLTFPPIRESEWEKMEALVRSLFASIRAQKPELVINDWGMAEWIRREYPGKFDLTLGILLNKRRKDVRLPFKLGADQQYTVLRENSLNASFYQEYLYSRYRISSYSYESCGYCYEIPRTIAASDICSETPRTIAASDICSETPQDIGTSENGHILHMPFYQMNTAGNCTLYAACTTGDRGRQTLPVTCPRFCEQRVFLYPDMLHMVGWQNSLFGYDDRILWDAEYFHSLCTDKVKRIVLNFLP